MFRLSDNNLTSLAYTGGKSKIAPILARFRPWAFEEYREPFFGGGAMFNHLRRIAPCQRYWVNDIDPAVVTYHRMLRDDGDALILRLLDIIDEHGGGTQALFDHWQSWRKSSNPLDVAVVTYLRGLITRGSEKTGFGFAKSRVPAGKALTRSKIIRLRGFAELLQGVRITNTDYREVMDADGCSVFIFADPPYEAVGEDCYKFGKLNLDEFAATIDRCQHSCLWTLNASDTTKAAFAKHSVIEHSMRYSAHVSKNAKEIIGANYTTPLFDIHARQIGVKLPKMIDAPVITQPAKVAA